MCQKLEFYHDYMNMIKIHNDIFYALGAPPIDSHGKDVTGNTTFKNQIFSP